MAVQLCGHGPQAAEEGTEECHVAFCRSTLKTSLKLRFRYLQKGPVIVTIPLQDDSCKWEVAPLFW